MTSTILPASIFILGALLVPLVKGRAKSVFLLAIPVLGFINLLAIPHGVHLGFEFLGMTLTPLKVDKLSLVWGYIFHIMGFLGLMYALSEKNDLEYMAALLYAGSSLGVVFAGDLFTLFCFWELMALGSALLIWARRTERSWRAGIRYLFVHLTGGLLLMFGVILYYFEHSTLDVGYIGLDGGLSSYLIFLGVGVNCAWPLLHAWLVDAYPEATVAGSVFLSAFTTKTAVYVLARMFPGTELLIWIGAVMTAFPIFYAVIENDLRRVLSYSLINQVGFMVVGIGIGTELSLNGTAAHAFAHILYKALLFMSMGAVLRQTGKINATDIGGLYRTMPWTATFCAVGAASISAFPFFSGFVSKSLIMSASAHEGYTVVWLTLLFASAGVFHHSGIKIPFFAFFSHDSGLRPKEAPLNMLIAMGITAFLCVAIGVYPEPLYSILPYKVDYVPYTASHVLSQFELLIFSALAFTLLMLSGIYPSEQRALNLDTDWFYRRGTSAFLRFVDGPLAQAREAFGRVVFNFLPSSLGWFSRNPMAAMKMGVEYVQAEMTDPVGKAEIHERLKKERQVYPGDIIKHWPVGTTVVWVTLCLLAFLLIYYL